MRLSHHDPDRNPELRAKKAHLRRLIDEQWKNDIPDHHNGRLVKGTLRVSVSLGDGYQKWRYEYGNDPFYDYRTLLPNQIVWDVGDNRPDGTPTPWEDTRRFTHALWDALNYLGLRYWGALSGGKGTHTEVFLHHGISGDDRARIARIISAVADQFLTGQAMPIEGIEYDNLLITHREHSRVVREFGAVKAHPKTLWVDGPTRYTRLPESREAAYASLPATAPTAPASLPTNPDSERLLWQYRMENVGYGTCPKGPQCIPGPLSDLDWFNCCKDCKRLD